MYKHFFEQHITRYNRQWYCYLCKTKLKNLIEAQRHSKDAHSTISTQTINFLNKFIILTNKGYKMLSKHSIVMRDIQQDYFCVCCQCSIPSLLNFYQHTKKKNHQKYMKNAILKHATNKQQNFNDNTNNKQNVSINTKNSTECMNESNLSKVQSVCENKLIKDGSNNSTQMINNNIASVPYALLQDIKKYKQFLMKHQVHYGQWYCHLCKSMFHSLSDITCHSQIAHPDIGTQISNFQKSIQSSNINSKNLSNHEIAMKNIPQDNFCVPCQCPIPTFEHFHQHSTGKKHNKCMIKFNENCLNTNNVKDPANKQDNANSDIIDNQNISVAAPHGNNSIKNVPSNFRIKEENTSFKFYKEDSISDDVLQIKRRVNIVYCCLCDRFIYKTTIETHMKSNLHMSIVRLITTFDQQALIFMQTCIIKLDEERNIIRAIQLNSKKFDETIWPEYTKIAARYSCDQCDKIIEEDDIINHEITVHEDNMRSCLNYIYNWSRTLTDFNIANHYPLFKCSFCNEILHGVLALSVHFSKREHEENIKSLVDIKRREYDNCKDIRIYFEPLEFLSIISFKNNDGAVDVKEQSLIYIKNHYTTFRENSSKLIYICFACQCNICTPNNIINHLCTVLEHVKHFKNICLTYDYMYDVLISEEQSMTEIHEIKSLVSEEDDESDDNESLQKLNETQVKAEKDRNYNLIAAANINDKNDKLYQSEENNSGFFVSFNIFKDINTHNSVPLNQKTAKFNKQSAQNHYNQTYDITFLDFEEIMFVCNERKLQEIRLNLPFFLPQFNSHMLCLICNDLQLCNVQTIYEHINCMKHVTKFEKLNENKERFELLRELIQPTDSENAKCLACNVNLRGMYKKASKSVDYKFHTNFSGHKKCRNQLLSQAEVILKEFQHLWYDIQYFACVECNMRYKQKLKFLKHLQTQHEEVLNNKDNSMFDFCLTCATLWYKREGCLYNDICISYQIHSQLRTHRYLQKSNDFAVTPLPCLQTLLKNVNETARNLFKLSNYILNDRKTIQLTDALKHIFKTRRLPVEVCMFGSRVTGLALSNSDIDIFLNFGDECTKPKVIKNRSKQIQDCLRADCKNWDIELTLDRSRTPIIKVKHRLTGLQCDISFTNGLSVENSKFIKSFNTAYPPCQKLTLFLKKWLSQTNLAGSDGIINYALVWLVIFYLQIKFQAPSIAALIESHNQSKIVSGWETGVGDTILMNLPELSTHELLLGFFKYYGSFDYMRFVICPLLGDKMPKKDFSKISTLPKSMRLYIAQLKSKNREYFRIDSPMCVQDPFDLSHNLTKAVPILTLKSFKHYCNESLSILCRNFTTVSSKKKNQ